MELLLFPLAHSFLKSLCETLLTENVPEFQRCFSIWIMLTNNHYLRGLQSQSPQHPLRPLKRRGGWSADLAIPTWVGLRHPAWDIAQTSSLIGRPRLHPMGFGGAFYVW
jgi:hypothetical protein